MSSVQANLRYTKDHEWVMVEEEIAIVGITDHAQSELGDITFIELPEEDAEFNGGDEAANIESVKAASPVYAPVTGTIVEVNGDLEESPENVNHDPYDSGWIFKIEMKDPSELDYLMDSEEYESYLEELADNS
ncbi:MAG: glycine cleavage system protein GcvH [Planctomycetes bacterium]|nr:glycine cleavage system protein GcvH [Planctomycetota bacterium]